MHKTFTVGIDELDSAISGWLEELDNASNSPGYDLESVTLLKYQPEETRYNGETITTDPEQITVLIVALPAI